MADVVWCGWRNWATNQKVGSSNLLRARHSSALALSSRRAFCIPDTELRRLWRSSKANRSPRKVGSKSRSDTDVWIDPNNSGKCAPEASVGARLSKCAKPLVGARLRVLSSVAAVSPLGVSETTWLAHAVTCAERTRQLFFGT